jgi:hypothetical protein
MGSRQKLMLFRPTLGQGGADRVTVTLLEHFDRSQFAPSLALVRREGEWVSRVPEDVPIYALNAARVATCLPAMVQLVRREQPDVLFSTASGTNAIAVLARGLAGTRTRVVLSERNVLLHGKVTFKKKALKKALMRLKGMQYKQADQITAVSGGVRDDLIRRLGLPPEMISVVYNPVVTDELERCGDPVCVDGAGECVCVVVAVRGAAGGVDSGDGVRRAGNFDGLPFGTVGNYYAECGWGAGACGRCGTDGGGD